MSKLEQLVRDVEERARSDDPAALADATKLVAEHAEEPTVWSLRAYIFARNGNHANAISDLTRAMDLSSPEPWHYFDRGRYKLKLGDNTGAVGDFSRGLELCDEYEDDYYRESFYFLRAEALLKAGKRQPALADIQKVRDGFTLWTTELRTKEDLLAEFR